MRATLESLSTKLLLISKSKDFTLATAESCTAGLIGAWITYSPGSSSYFDRGFITYTNEAKEQMLGVLHETLQNYGAVSEEVARQMAKGAKDRAKSTISVAVSGIAGPDGGTNLKPVGTVCVAFAIDNKIYSKTCHFTGDRTKVRESTVIEALNGFIYLLEGKDLQGYKTQI